MACCCDDAGSSKPSLAALLKHMPMVDTHQHFWDPQQEFRGPADPLGLSQGHGASYFPFNRAPGIVDTAIGLDHLNAEFRAATAGCNVIKSVHVECRSNRDVNPALETQWLCSLAETDGFPHAIVAYADLELPVDELDAQIDGHLKVGNLLRAAAATVVCSLVNHIMIWCTSELRHANVCGHLQVGGKRVVGIRPGCQNWDATDTSRRMSGRDVLGDPTWRAKAWLLADRGLLLEIHCNPSQYSDVACVHLTAVRTPHRRTRVACPLGSANWLCQISDGRRLLTR